MATRTLLSPDRFANFQHREAIDLLGLSDRMPPFAKSYANLRQTITQAVADFSTQVRDREFP